MGNKASAGGDGGDVVKGYFDTIDVDNNGYMEREEFINFSRQKFKIVPEDRLQQIWKEVKKNPELGEGKIDLETFTENFQKLTQVAADSKKAVQYEVSVDAKPFGIRFTKSGVIYQTTTKATDAGVKPGSQIISVAGKPVNGKTFLKTFSAAKVPFPMVLQTMFKYERTVTAKPFGFGFTENEVTSVSPNTLAATRTDVEGNSEAPVEVGDVISRVGGDPVEAANFPALYGKSEPPFVITFLTSNQQKVTEGAEPEKTPEGAEDAPEEKVDEGEGAASSKESFASSRRSGKGGGKKGGRGRAGAKGRGRGGRGRGGAGKKEGKSKVTKSVQAEYKERLQKVLPRDKHANIGSLLTKNSGKEHELYLKICKKYKKRPEKQYRVKSL